MKPDYEALSLSKWEEQHLIMVLGSGSYSTKRDWAYIHSLEKNKTHSIKLTKFYKHLKELSKMKEEDEINIEGIASTGTNIFLLGRGLRKSNYIFEIPEENFIDYIFKRSSKLPDIEVHQILLPEIAGIEASLSGGCFLARENALVVTASVEASEDIYADGAILGSFIGFVKLNSLKKKENMKHNFSLLVDKNKIVPTKLESIVVTGRHDGNLNALLVSNNEKGVSEFFSVTMIPPEND